ncbi:hypothetical protein BDW72DRAFT_191664 [Aspergillus terricola var. indicus]
MEFPCAHWAQEHSNVRCPKNGYKACQNCHLVLTSHWPIHKLDCKSSLNSSTWRPKWDIEGRSPTFISAQITDKAFVIQEFGGTKYLWGKVPAIDWLRLKDNEGKTTSQNLSILAASGDLRNVIKTINALPQTYSGCLNLDLNDGDETVALRNIILMIVAFHFQPEKASIIMLHLCYSAFLRKDMLESVQSVCIPFIQNLLASGQEGPTGLLLKGTCTHNKATLTAALPRVIWERILLIFTTPSRLSFDEAVALRRSVTLAKHRQDQREGSMFRLPPPWRLAQQKFREDGVLLPFGASRDRYNIPNPTFFENTSWPMPDSADPFDGWKLSEILRSPYGAKNDLYGQLYLHVMRNFVTFCERLSTLKLNIYLWNAEPIDLARDMLLLHGNWQAYDRIDLADIADTSQQLAKYLAIFRPLLRTKEQNQKATLLTIFLNVVLEMRTYVDQKERVSRMTSKVQEFMSLDSAALSRGCYKADYINFLNAHDLFVDRTAIFNRFTMSTRLVEMGASVGLRMKSRHTVIAKWPLRLPKFPTKHEFEMLHWSPHHGSERYVEWQRQKMTSH